MIGIDTNVLVRFVVVDDADQSRAARDFIEKSCTAEQPGYVNRVVLCEMIWVLSSGYRYDRSTIIARIERLLAASELAIEGADDVRDALEDYRAGAIGFTDALIARTNQRLGCTTTVTFDRKAARHSAMTPLA